VRLGNASHKDREEDQEDAQEDILLLEESDRSSFDEASNLLHFIEAIH